MPWLLNLLMAVQVLTAIGVIALVLLQHGKGADMGAAFGSGASGSLFGATGSANFLSRTTSILAAVFFCSTLGLALLVGARPEAPGSVMDTVPSGMSPAPATQPPSDVPNAAPSDVPASAAPTGSDVPAAGAPASDVSTPTQSPASSGNAPAGSSPAAQPSPANDSAPQKNGAASDIPK